MRLLKIKILVLLAFIMASMSYFIAYAVEPGTTQAEGICITALDGPVDISLSTDGNDGLTLEYKKGAGEYSSWDYSTEVLSIVKDESVYIRASQSDANNNWVSKFHDFKCFSFDGGTVKVSGHITDLLREGIDKSDLPEHCFAGLFAESDVADASELILDGMGEECYYEMFYGCESLTSIPRIPEILADQCCKGMFYGCTALEIIPEDALSATVLAESCYQEMFAECSKLATVSNLPATELATACYYAMFADCERLSYVKVGFTDWNSYEDTDDWLDGVADTGKFVCMEELDTTTRGEDSIPEGWTVERYTEPEEPENMEDTPPTYSYDYAEVTFFTGYPGNPVKNGTWKLASDGSWSYTTSRAFRNTWGYIYNPYASEGQSKTDWFWFDANGKMVTGWNKLYWNDKTNWYYFKDVHDGTGTYGACQLGGVTPDGYTLNIDGSWNGI